MWIFYLLILLNLNLREYWRIESAFKTHLQCISSAVYLSLVLKFTTVSQLLYNVLIYSNYAGPNY